MSETPADIYIGTMSGTSMDGLDLVAVRFDAPLPHLLHQQTRPYPEALKLALQQIALNPNATLDEMCTLDSQLGQFYARQINHFIDQYSIDQRRIRAIGNHGQTIRHAPNREPPYSLQIGDANIIAALCNIDVVADFRRRDIALGGQGAPLTPAFHQQVFGSDTQHRVIINIGGIANLTLLPATTQVEAIGFDSGPGNTLMDFYCQHYLQQDFDDSGELACSGTPDLAILQQLLNDPYFTQPAPKSTGTDYFSPDWLKSDEFGRLNPADALATVTELSARSIANAARSLPLQAEEYYICGGGAHNRFLLQRLAQLLAPANVQTTEALGIHPDWVEATAFAWLARQTLLHQAGNLPSATNAKYASILGAVYFSNGQKKNLC
jgi:anhydro-N-acetylmuramic acid kinase